MKKKNLKNLQLKKQSISKLNANEINGGTGYSIVTCLWSCTSCPTVNCTKDIICYLTKTFVNETVCFEENK